MTLEGSRLEGPPAARPWAGRLCTQRSRGCCFREVLGDGGGLPADSWGKASREGLGHSEGDREGWRSDPEVPP